MGLYQNITLGAFYAWAGSNGMFPQSQEVLVAGLVALEQCFAMMVLSC